MKWVPRWLKSNPHTGALRWSSWGGTVFQTGGPACAPCRAGTSKCFLKSRLCLSWFFCAAFRLCADSSGPIRAEAPSSSGRELEERGGGDQWLSTVSRASGCLFRGPQQTAARRPALLIRWVFLGLRGQNEFPREELTSGFYEDACR